MRVLLVDDEEEFVATLAERLSIRGIDVDWVTTGEEALKKVEAKVYDLAVLDVKIPKMSGIELKKKMEERCPDMRYIFMTGHGSEQNFKKGSSEAGVGYYLVKPVHIDALIKKMEEVFKKE
jgi:DNA-binding response OmpR family regulator